MAILRDDDTYRVRLMGYRVSGLGFSSRTEHENANTVAQHATHCLTDAVPKFIWA